MVWELHAGRLQGLSIRHLNGFAANLILKHIMNWQWETLHEKETADEQEYQANRKSGKRFSLYQ